MILCLLLATGILFVGLWPLDTSPRNKAYWLPGQEGLHFDGRRGRLKLSVGGIAYTPAPLRSSGHDLTEKGSVKIEILLTPARDWARSVLRIVTFIDDSGKEVLYLGQWKQSLIVRWLDHDQTGKARKREIGVAGALEKGKPRLLTITSSRQGTSIYLDGMPAKHHQGTALLGERESIRGLSVILGNSRDLKSSWTGSILALRVFERASDEGKVAQEVMEPEADSSHWGLIADYSFEKNHEGIVPDLSGNRNEMEVPRQINFTNRILAWPDRVVLKGVSLTGDVIVNIVGFVPFGFLLAFWHGQAKGARQSRSFLFAVLIGVLVSFTIEVAQAFIPVRDSSLIDLMCNTGGAVLGALLTLVAGSDRLGGWKLESEEPGRL